MIQSDFEILFDGKQILVGDGLQDGLAAVQDIQIADFSTVCIRPKVLSKSVPAQKMP